MAFMRKTWTLIHKNIILNLYRNWLTTVSIVFFAPIIFFFFISYAKNFFIPPADFGVGTPVQLRTLGEAVAASSTSRRIVPFVTNNLGSEVDSIIDELAPIISQNGGRPVILDTADKILTTCPASVRSTTPCFAAVQFQSSPSRGGAWNYTLRADGSFGQNVYAGRDTNEAQIYVLPLQYAVDAAIARRNGTSLPRPRNQIYTSKTAARRDRDITVLYMDSLINVIGIAYFVGFAGILYQLTGLMATEREIGISQLIEVMTARRYSWEAQAMRLLSYHLSYDMFYAPAWIISGIIVSRNNFPDASVAICLFYFLLSGLSFCSWSIFLAGFFRKAQLSGITVTLFSFVLAIIAQLQTPKTTGAIVITALLFPPMNFIYFIISMARWQQQNLGANIVRAAPTSPWQVPIIVMFIFAILHTLAYPFLGALVERLLYGTASGARNVQRTGGDARETVRVTGLSKHYPASLFARTLAKVLRRPAPEVVVAVDDLSVTILKGELSVLLGANGAGKSTTMDMLAGLQKPTAGHIEIDGASIGICPQKNVLWDELTCEEHVQIFNSLKSSEVDSKATRRDLLIACDLQQKLGARSETLSGGQKRKLQLAMMLTGGSNLCLLDEVSSGIDPLSRRKVWDILLRERGNRSLIFSTHFLDEADFLSDTITILSKGKVVAHGSSVELKQVHGGGYRIKIYNSTHFKEPAEWSQLKKQTYSDHVVYNLPDSSSASAFAERLESLGVKEYRVDGPTVEDVFLKLAEEARSALGLSAIVDDKSSLEKASSLSSDDKGLQLHPGRRLSLAGQTWVLLRKRFTILKRNSLPYLAATLLPIITAALTLLFLKGFTRVGCLPGDAVRERIQFSLANLGTFYSTSPRPPIIPYGPTSRVTSQVLGRLLAGITLNSTQVFSPVGSEAALESLISTNYSRIFPGGFYLDEQSGPLFAWRADNSVLYSVFAQNLMNNAQLGGSPLITLTYQSFSNAWIPELGNTLQAVLYFTILMAIYPAFFSLYPTRERINRVRALHWSNGVRVLPLWTAYILFDLIFVFIISAVCAGIYATVARKLYFSNYFFLIFLLYGIASQLLAYILTLHVKSQLAGFATAALYQVVAFMLYFLAYLLANTFAPQISAGRLINTLHFALAIFAPASNLMRVLLVTYNQFSVACVGEEVQRNPAALTAFGGPILYLVVQIFVFFAILMWLETGWRPAFLGRKTKPHKDTEIGDDVDSTVYDEKRRVDACDDELRVKHVSKQFGENLAVDDVCFAVPRDQVFALLGPNGAGKSTTFGLIRGDIRPTGREGDVLVENVSIVRDRTSARVHQGVCPQFDAMDAMTVTEHLQFYARARGVGDVDHNVAAVIEAVGLQAYKGRLASKLSGGNKRKLSLGIALVGDPTVLLIDEGSSGMDAAAKRVMWRTLKDVSAGRSMVISTHAMEEADALAGRVGIMAGKMLALGTSDELRQRYGDELNVHVVHRDAPYTSDADMGRLKAWVVDSFPDATIEDRTFHGQLRFVVPNGKRRGAGDGTAAAALQHADGNIGKLFGKLEAARDDLGIAFFAVNQPTLDSVFLQIVGKHKVLEENYEKEHGKQLSFAGRWKRSLAKVYHNA